MIPLYDVFTITETKLDEHATQASISISGYQLYRQDRTRHGGGVATYIRDTLRPSPQTEMENWAVENGIEATISSICLQGKSSKATILGIYRPPSSRCAWFESLNELIIKLIPHGPLIVLGDLNSDLMKPNVYPGKALLNSLSLAGTKVPKILPTRSTSHSSTSIDLISMDVSFQCLEYFVDQNAASDHSPVIATIMTSPTEKKQPVLKRSFNKVDYVKLHRRVADIEMPVSRNRVSPQTG